MNLMFRLTLVVLCLTGTASGQHAASAPAIDPGPTVDEARLLTGIRQLTFEGRRAGEGYFSRDGSKMIFQSEREPNNPFFQIYLLDMKTGDTQRISPGIGKTTCAWIHPDGDRVLFASTHDDEQARQKQVAELEARAAGTQRRYEWDYDEHYDIYESVLGTNQLRNLTQTPGYDAEGSYSPNGHLIAFSSNRHAYRGEMTAEQRERFDVDKSYMLDIYVMNADGSNVRRLTSTPGYDGGPFFSPDSLRICWRRFSEDGATAEIYTMTAEGADVRQLTRLGAMSWAPFYHPSNEYLIFTTNRHGFANFELYIVDVAGGCEPIRVTSTSGFDGLPVFTPDGSRLAWTSNRTPDRSSQIFIADWNHAEAMRLLAECKRSSVAPQVAVSKPAADLPEALIVTGIPIAETSPEIVEQDVRSHVAALASDAMEGRLTGTRGEQLATRYVAERFIKMGLQPAGNDGSYYQEFTFTSGVKLGPGNTLQATVGGAAVPAALDSEFRPLAISRSGKAEAAPVVFAGYGLVAPKSGEHESYDSYVHLDVKDKWVMVLRFLPEGVTPERRQHLSQFASLRNKSMVAWGRGARGLLVVSGPNSQVREQLVKLDGGSGGGASVFAISISDELAGRLLAQSGKTLKDLQDALDTGAPQMGFELPGVQIAAQVDLEKIRQTGRNVLARLPAGQGKSAPSVILGAHIDHLGRGESGDSLGRDAERGQIHYGADDNASGVAVMLEVAEQLAAEQPSGGIDAQRDILFAAWSGEELGLLGSKHFADQLAAAAGKPEHLRDQIGVVFNLDMVGRLDKSLILQGVGSSSAWRGEIERRNAPLGVPVVLSDDSYLPTDATSFYLYGVPILSGFTGAHAEYHTPRDRMESLNYAGAAQVGKLFALLVRAAARSEAAPDFVAMQRQQTPGLRGGLRAYLGTIPDYTEAPIPGLRISGTMKNGPAEKAGLRGGDVIVELAGRKIANVYDYTAAIEGLKIGQTVKIAVMREGQRVEMDVTPTSRD